MKIIGITGFAGSGKDTVAEILRKDYGYIKESFAKRLKDATSVLFGWDRELLEGDSKKSREWREQPDPWWSQKLERDFSPRLALQLMGTEVGRDIFHKDFWIFALESQLEEDKNYVISDVRFPNEVKRIKELDGTLIRIARGEEPAWVPTALVHNAAVFEKSRGNEKLYQRLEETGQLMSQAFPNIHYSEWAWIGTDFNYVIHNNGTLEDLQNEVAKILEV